MLFWKNRLGDPKKNLYKENNYNSRLVVKGGTARSFCIQYLIKKIKAQQFFLADLSNIDFHTYRKMKKSWVRGNKKFNLYNKIKIRFTTESILNIDARL